MARSITDVKGITVGCQEDLEALTGCTVVLTGSEGMVCGVDVRGSAPGTRETDILTPENLIEKVHAVLLTGGSAYGLNAAGGVMQYLEEQGIGYDVGPTVVPIVPAAVIFDLGVGDYRVRPDKEMGYKACLQAGLKVAEGNAGAGAGATVGKIRGFDYCCKGGQGTWSESYANGLVVGALVVVNSVGDIVNPRNGKVIAGVRGDADQPRFIGAEAVWHQQGGMLRLRQNSNTVIAVVASNARLSKAHATKIAKMAHDGLARVISPAHTMHDGDTIFALASGEIETDVSYVGYLTQKVLAAAVMRAVRRAKTIQGLRNCYE